MNRQKQNHEQASVLAAIVARPDGIKLSMQDGDERVELLMRRHWVTNIPWFLTVCAGLAAPVVLAFFEIGWNEVLGGFQLNSKFYAVLLVVWYMLVLGFSFTSFLNWFFNVYIVTNKRIIDVDYWGLFFHRISDAYLDQVQDVSHDVQGMWEIMFDFGDVFVQTASETLNIDFISVPDPEFVHQKITELVAQSRRKKQPH